ncbi:MAG: hypothetical protein OEY50_06120, partial [Nitrospinota bacterium]|nr:hypothetical protein [Nitrospinota bacterium]
AKSILALMPLFMGIFRGSHIHQRQSRKQKKKGELEVALVIQNGYQLIHGLLPMKGLPSP